MVREKRVFSRIVTDRIVSQKYASTIRIAFDKDTEEAIRIMDDLKDLLVEEEGVSDSWADIICGGFSEAVKYFNGIGTTQIFNVDIDDGFLLQKKPISPLEVATGEGGSQSHETEERIKKAEQGDVASQYYLADSYYNGKELAQDYSAAFYWAKKAAEQGNPYAQNLMGCMLEGGEGVQQDSSEAVKWFQLAADQGYSIAQYNLGYCFDKGIGLKQDFDMAIYWIKLAAEQGYDKAQYVLGLNYIIGYGVPKSLKIAAEYLLESALQGNSDAEEQLISLFDCFIV